MKYVFLDIDGTLVSFNTVMPASARTALLKAHQNGHKLILCTGRRKKQIYPWLLSSFPFDGLITSGGAYAEAGGEPLVCHYFTQESLDKLQAYFNENHIPYCFQMTDGTYCEPWCEQAIGEIFAKVGITREFLEKSLGYDIFTDLTGPPDTVEKVVFYNARRNVATVNRELDNAFHVVRYSFGDMGDTCGEISLPYVNKALGIERILAHWGGSMVDTISFGDGGNDMEMLRTTHIGVAMGNAVPSLKEAADYVTDSVEEDGLAKAFEKFGLL